MYVSPLEEGPDPRCIVEADIVAGVRSIRLSELEGLNIRVLRPIGLGDTDLGRLAAWVVSQIGGEYDLNHAWVLARKFLPVPAMLSSSDTPSGITEGAARFICSTLIANAFALVGYSISTADHRQVIPGDFETASVFEVVNPPADASLG
jgi:hypothetical protein